MKKNSILFAVILSATLFSCQKEELTPTSPTSQVSSSASSSSAQVRLVSNWLSLSFAGSRYENGGSLQATYSISSAVNYDFSSHVQLAFVRIQGRNSDQYERIPMILNTPQGDMKIDFKLTKASFAITVWSISNTDKTPSSEYFGKMHYRYIVIPKSIFESYNIDWNNYAAVSQVLNL